MMLILPDTKDTYKERDQEFYMQNKRKPGGCYEAAAAAYLEKQGLVILRKNYRCRLGEIDLIARDGRYLVFIEVKYRNTAVSGSALTAVNPTKQQVISRVAEYFLAVEYHSMDLLCRFDVVGIDGDEFTWIKNAFDCWN